QRPTMGIITKVDRVADGLQLRLQRVLNIHSFEAAAVLFLIIGTVIPRPQRNVENHTVVFEVLVMTMPGPVGALYMDFDVALHNLTGETDSCVEKVRTFSGIPTSRFQHLHLLATGGVEICGPEHLVAP